jgi:P4 family phage/plasmid primase-like protien
MSTNKTQLQYALQYARYGLKVLPLYGIHDGHCACKDGKNCNRPGKHPRTKNGVHDATTDSIQIKKWWGKWPNANIGIAAGKVSDIIVIDIDPRHKGTKTLKMLEAKFGPLPSTMTSHTGGGGEHRYFKYPSFDVKSDTAGKVFGPGVDLISDDSIVVAPKSRHVSGHHYSWSKGPDPLTLPQTWAEYLKACTKSSRKLKEPRDGLIAEGQRNNHLTSLAGKLWRNGASRDALLAALLAENDAQCSPPLNPEEVEKIAASVTQYAPGVSAENRSDPAEVLMRSVLDQWFAGGKHLMFAPDGQFWEFDVKLWRPVSDAWIKGKILDAVQTGANQTTASLVSQTLALLKAKLAAKEDRLGFITNPPPVINCANGEVWIATDGSVELRPHKPESFLRHCLSVNYDPDAKSPMYDKTLLEIFSVADDAEAMASHWNELAGYIIQPRRSIPLIGVLWGGGDNGKTKLIATVRQLLGEQLVCAQPIENFDKNRFAMGSLFGKLLFVDDDVRAGIKLPDGMLKTVSEAKAVTGELKFKPPFNFLVRTVPILLCNNVPSLADLSHGMLRRLMVIPFQRTFTEEDKDATLFDRIWANELAGVLNRALQGLQRLIRREWQFDPPSDVKAATQRFIRDANPLPAFIDERCELGPDHTCWMKAFYVAYCDWAEANGITLVQQQPTVRKNLEHMGYKITHGNKGSKCFGLRLKTAFERD